MIVNNTETKYLTSIYISKYHLYETPWFVHPQAWLVWLEKAKRKMYTQQELSHSQEKLNWSAPRERCLGEQSKLELSNDKVFALKDLLENRNGAIMTLC